jgi:hypothetical protein
MLKRVVAIFDATQKVRVAASQHGFVVGFYEGGDEKSLSNPGQDMFWIANNITAMSLWVPIAASATICIVAIVSSDTAFAQQPCYFLECPAGPPPVSSPMPPTSATVSKSVINVRADDVLWIRAEP